MLLLKKYPKHFLLMISCAPFILIGAGVLVLTLAGMSWYYAIGVALIVAGLKFPVTRINTLVMYSIFQKHLCELQDDNWMGLFLEDSKTSDKIKLVPDDIALITKEGENYYIITSNQNKTQFPIEQTSFENLSQNELFCSINCLDKNGNKLFPFMISPVYTGDNWYIASSGQKRFEWFMTWLKCTTEEAHCHSDDEILHLN
ncbi:hypothetical protein PQO01_03940 [Lentisphaera marina]|uniref:hypothetical protein n=1 Tax=Lentisphaera marina TaxID=1111041 RepID=UPI0023656B8F|nr:hypothetical protein [Lentisphaera marina]MDD7984102.1 hypothetical protein [Lentisphaera marina]